MATTPDAVLEFLVAQVNSYLAAANVTAPAGKNWAVVVAADGKLHSAYPSGVVVNPPTIATIPDFTQKSANFSVDLAPYVSGSYTSLALVVVTGTLAGSGWSFAGTTLTYTAPTVATLTVRLQANSAGPAVTSNVFTIASIAAQAADTLAPSIVHGVGVALVANHPTVSFIAPMDPAQLGISWSGYSKAKLWRALAASPNTVTQVGLAMNAAAPGLQLAPLVTDLGAVTGTLTQSGASFTATALSGGDFFGVADNGRFAGNAVTGDFVAVVKVSTFTTSATNTTSPNAKVGLQARQTTAANSPVFGVYANPATQGAGYQAGLRTTLNGLTTNIGEVSGNYTGPIWLMLRRAGNVFTASVSFDGNAFSVFATQTVVFASQLQVGIAAAATDASYTLSAQLDEFGVTQDPVATFPADPIAQTGAVQNLLYSVSAVDVAGNESARSAAVAIAIPAAGTGVLLAYIKTQLAPATSKRLSGQTCDPWVSNPLRAINQNNPTWAAIATTGVFSQGAATGKIPAILDMYSAFPGRKGAAITSIGGGGTLIDGVNTGDNAWLGIAQGAQGLTTPPILKINYIPNNPAGLGINPWPAVITPGNAVYNTLVGWVQAFATMLKTLPLPVMITPEGENNLSHTGFGIAGDWDHAPNWGTIGQCTDQQSQTLNRLIRDTLVASGYKRFLYGLEVNFGQQNQLFGYAPDIFDFICADWQPTSYIDSSGYNLINGTGKPIYCGSQITTGNPAGQGANTVNTYTQGYQIIATNMANMCAAVTWAQGVSLANQTGAPQCLGASGSNWLSASDLTPFTSAGGLAGG